MNADDILEKRTLELAKLGIHTKVKEIMMKDPVTGEMQMRRVQVLDHADGPSLGAVAALNDEEKWSDKEKAYFEAIPGLAELRKQFFAEVASIKGCTGCKRGALLKKYMPRVMILLGNDPNKDALNPWKSSTNDNKNTGTGEVSASAGESAGGAEAHKSLLRRAAEGIAKVFRAGKKVG